MRKKKLSNNAIKKCLIIGDLNIDLILSGMQSFPKLGKEILADNHFIDIGGSGGIFAASLAALGTKTEIIGKIGNDFLGEYIKNSLKNFNVGLDHLISSKNTTGITVNLSYLKDKAQISSLGLVNTLNLSDIDIGEIKNIRHVHFSSYYLMSKLKRDYLWLINEMKSLDRSLTFSMDTNDDPSEVWDDEIYEIIKKLDIFFVNKKEAICITKKKSEKEALDYLSKFVNTVIVKMGNSGYIAKRGKKYFQEDAIKANFRDSTGAGDNFDAGFIHGYLNNLRIENCLKIANICGGISTEYLGGVGPREKFVRIKELIKDIKE